MVTEVNNNPIRDFLGHFGGGIQAPSQLKNKLKFPKIMIKFPISCSNVSWSWKFLDLAGKLNLLSSELLE